MESFAEAAAVRVAVRVVAGCGGASPSSIASAILQEANDAISAHRSSRQTRL